MIRHLPNAAAALAALLIGAVTIVPALSVSPAQLALACGPVLA